MAGSVAWSVAIRPIHLSFFFFFLYLLDQFNTREEIHAKVYECPLNALLRILFLFEDEHVVIEELLKLLIGEVDAQLLEAVELFEQQSGMLSHQSLPLRLCRFFRLSLFLFEDISCATLTHTYECTIYTGTHMYVRYFSGMKCIGQPFSQVNRQIFHTFSIITLILGKM